MYNFYYEKIGKNEPVKLEELPFDIPDNWIWIKIKNIANVYNGNSINEVEKNKKYKNIQGRDYISTKDVNFNGTINYNNGVNIPFNSNFKIAPKGKILMCIEGGSAGRKIAITNKEVNFGNKLACFDTLIINDHYLLSIFLSKEFLSLFKSSLTGIIGGVSLNTLKEFLIPLPPLAEQERIVNKLSLFEELFEKYSSIENELSKIENDISEKLKKSILQYAIEGKLVKQNLDDEPASVLLEHIKQEKEKLIKEGKIKKYKNDSNLNLNVDKNYYKNLPSIPSNWIYIPLGKLGTFTRGNGIKRNETFNQGYPCVRYGELYTTYKEYFTETKSYTTLEIYQKSKKIQKNDILMALTGENKEDISKAVVYLGDNKIAIGGDMTSFSSYNQNPFYISTVLNSPYGVSCKRTLATGDIIVHMSNDKLASIIIPLPPLMEQNRIVEKINIINQLIE